ncbi:acyl-ACP thioesterase domain-containing protein [uncultured Clostridium sp.]|jgi:acyl-ACP thioesterase|uniref:acyl-[acyl-carrier-protein] thioesterase n=1 Tax=uncultured Clostridium sp. TaxID=59620 RepID=UPI002610985F|nr:acyl-ACP thioesterase domain-containing protein [uncultured Clostridium sp.]
MSGVDFKKTYEILYRDIDKNFNCKVTSIMDCLTDVALDHEDSLGIDIQANNNHGLVFVFFEYNLKIHRYPKYKEKVVVRTHIDTIQKFYASRSFKVESESGESIATATSLAVMIDVEKRRLAKVPDEYYEKHEIDKNIKIRPTKLTIEKLENITIEKDIEIRFLDFDSNGHINNAKYFEWSLDVIPTDILKNYLLKEVKIKFTKEVVDEDKPKIEIEIIEENEEIKMRHKISNDKGEEVNIMESYWKRAE